MRLGDVGNIAPIVDWTSYVNNILTEDIGIQVSSFKFHFALYFINKQSIKQILIKMIGYYVFCILIDEILHTNKKLFDMVYWQFFSQTFLLLWMRTFLIVLMIKYYIILLSVYLCLYVWILSLSHTFCLYLLFLCFSLDIGIYWNTTLFLSSLVE